MSSESEDEAVRESERDEESARGGADVCCELQRGAARGAVGDAQRRDVVEEVHARHPTVGFETEVLAVCRHRELVRVDRTLPALDVRRGDDLQEILKLRVAASRDAALAVERLKRSGKVIAECEFVDDMRQIQLSISVRRDKNI